MADRYWRDTTPPYGFWSTTGNWSSTIGGAGGATVPGSADIAYFNNSVASSAFLGVFLNSSTGRSVLGLRFNSYSSNGLYIYGGTDTNVVTQTLSIGSSGIVVAAGGLAPILDQSVSVILRDSQTWQVFSGSTFEVLGSISGSTFLTFFSSDSMGRFTLCSPGITNTYSGGSSLSGATLRVGSSTAFGSGPVTITNGTLTSSSANNYVLGNAFYLNNTVAFCDASYPAWFALSGSINIATPTTIHIGSTQQMPITGTLNGSQPLSVTGISGAVLRLIGTTVGNFSSTLTIGTNATLHLANFTSGTPNQLNNAYSVVLASGSAMTFYGNASYAVPYSITGSGTVNVFNPTTITFNNTLSSNGPFAVIADSGNGLTQTQTVKFNIAAQLGAAQYYAFYSSNVVTWTSLTHVIEYTGSGAPTNAKIIFIDHTANNGGTFIYRNSSSGGALLTQSGDIWHNRPTIAETVTLHANLGPMFISGRLFEASTGILSVTKTGDFDVTLSGNNNFRGNLSLTAGLTKAAHANALGANNAATVSVATLTALSLDVAATYNAGKVLALTGVGPASGTGNTGSLILNNTGTNTFSGGITTSGGTYIRATASGTLVATITSLTNSDVRLGSAPGVTATFNGVISGIISSAGVPKNLLIGRSTTSPPTEAGSDTGTVVLGSANTYDAPTKINFGVLSVDADNKLGTVPVAPTAGYLDLGRGTSFKATGTFTLSANRGIVIGNNGYDLGSGDSSIEVASGQTLTYDGIIADNAGGATPLAKTGTGNLVLNGANTHSLGTKLTAGTLKVGSGAALGTGDFTQSASTVFQTPSNGKLTMPGAYVNNGGTLRIGGA